MSPDVYGGQNYDEKCDVWSLGVMIFELLYGCVPWIGKSVVDLFQNHIEKEPLTFPENPKRSRLIKSLIKKMLVVDPVKRIGWDDVFKYLDKFDAEVQEDEEIKKDKDENEEESDDENTTRIVHKTKVKLVVGNLYDVEFDPKSNKSTGIPTEMDEKKSMNQGRKSLANEKGNDKSEINEREFFTAPNTSKMTNVKISFESKEKIAKNQKKMKENLQKVATLKDSIFRNRNIAVFFQNLHQNLTDILEKKVLYLESDEKQKIYKRLRAAENSFLAKSKSEFEKLKSENLISKQELKDFFAQIQEIEKAENCSEIDRFPGLQRSLKRLLQANKNAFSEKALNFDKKIYQSTLFCILIVKAEKPEDIFAGSESEGWEQKFYDFYEKYERMSRAELIMEIRDSLKSLFKND